MASRPKKSRSRRQRKEQPEQQEVEQQLLDARHAQAELMASVVKVLCTHVEPNYSLPWQMRRQNQSASTGFVIDVDQRHVITNAHSVEHHTQVKLKRRGSDTKYVATVLAIGRECDIALLTVADDAFWEGLLPLSFGPLPELQEAVAVVGYPIGGETISVTSGVVSRIEVTSYVHGRDELLGIQIDAAINSGNSGGPAFNDDGDCIGIAFQSMAGSGDAENIGYVIPTPIVKHFLRDFERNGRYTGFAALGICWQPMESPDLRKAFGLSQGEKGVLIRRVAKAGAAAGRLEPQDVVLSVDGVTVANDGTVQFREEERINFSYLVSGRFIGDSLPFEVLRKGQRQKLTVALRPRPSLVPIHLSGKGPAYLIVAGLVFVAASEPYLQSEYGDDYQYDAPVTLLERMLHGYAMGTPWS